MSSLRTASPSRHRLLLSRCGVMLALALVLVLALGVAGCGAGTPARVGTAAPPTDTTAARGVGEATPRAPQPPPRANDTRPNIVLVLTDDLSNDLLPYMSQVSALQHRGLTFRNYFVSDSLCCPSRASIFTGNFPHDTGVFTNNRRDGGINAFWAHHDERHVFNLALYKAGYRTAMMGKYLNGYLEGHGRSPVPSTYVPPGWSDWDVAGWGYPEYNYTLNENGVLHHYGSRPRDYLTSVLTRLGTRFISSAAAGRRPFFLELATFTPHDPFVPAPQDAHRFGELRAPHPPNWNRLPTHPPDWLRGHKPLTAGKLHRINRTFRRRVQDVQSIDRMLRAVEAAVAKNHLTRNTYFVFTSDNGYHTGEYRLLPGKLTAFDTDIHVPLIIAGPGIRPGSNTTAMAENIDLGKTFTSLAHTRFSCDGRSLTPLLTSPRTPSDWRNAVLIEHHGPTFDRDDPDRQNFASGNPTTYAAIRTPDFLYVEYRNGQREFYDLRDDPYELHNDIGKLRAGELIRLHAALQRLRSCHTGATCWRAGHLAAPFIERVAASSSS